MAKNLVIVESPAKARTLTQILGRSYTVKASVGHVRDLPKSQLGVDVDNGFTPKYLIPKEKKAVVKELKEAASKVSSIYLATDPDREGEAISWHLVEAADFNPKHLHRVVFHEITPQAVEQAFQHPRAIDMNLVQAQQARRILDRLVGYKLSPLLWRKVRWGLSAGRVQSAALRIVAEREREIESFVPQEYWVIEAELAAKKGGTFRATLAGIKGEPKLTIPRQQAAQDIVKELEKASYSVSKIDIKESSRQPAPPFITSTLQQEAWRKLRFSAQHTMAVAQQLYEGLAVGDEGTVGLITYMRTDSPRAAAPAIDETRDYIAQKYGKDYLPPHPRHFTARGKGAQEAHEAIRPTKISREPEMIKRYLTPDQSRLYQLIWKRMVASQMAAAQLLLTTVQVEGENHHSAKVYLLRASSIIIKFPGFTQLYSESKDEEEEALGKLPPLNKGEEMDLKALYPQQRFTQPPPRYTEATLIKALEEKGIGRPSTYAPILSTIQQRDYTMKREGKFYLQEMGKIVDELLRQNFPEIVDLDFTARMEEELDEIAQGKMEWVPTLREFYTPFEKALEKASQNIDKVKLPQIPTEEPCPRCGKLMVIKQGRFGKFLSCSTYPECKGTAPYLVKMGVHCPECGAELVERMNKKKRLFYGCSGYPKCNFLTNQKPVPQPCPRCGGLLTQQGQKEVKCLKCQYKGKLEELETEGAGVSA